MTVTLPRRISAIEDSDPARRVDVASVAETLETVELLNGGVWLAGKLDRGHFRRLSDYVNHAHGRILLRDATIVDRLHPDRRRPMRDTWIDPTDLDVIAQRLGGQLPPAPDMAVPKRRYIVTALTSSHQISGTVHVHQEADLDAFLISEEPPLMVLTDASLSWLADDRAAATFELALVNRRRTFALMAS